MTVLAPDQTTPFAETQTLSSGMRLVYHPMPGAPRVSMSFYLSGGNCIDSIPGQQDLISRLLTKGTKQRSAEAIAIALDELSLDLDSDTGRDFSVLTATCLRENLPDTLPLIQELLFQSTLAEQPKELERWEGELAMELDSPRARAADLLIKTAYENTPYGVTASVMQQQLSKLKTMQGALPSSYEAAYQTESITLVVSGDCELDTLVNQLEAAFPRHGNARPSTLAERVDKAHAAIQALSLEKDKIIGYPWPDAKQCHIFKTWYTPTVNSEDYPPLMLLNTILGGGGLSSRLFIELRDKQGLAYNVRSSLESYAAKGSFKLYIGTEPKNTEKSLNGFKVEVQKLIDTPVPQQEFDDAKKNLLGRRTVFLETPSQWTGYIGNNLMIGRDLEALATIDELIKAVTIADVQRVAQTYLTQPSLVSIAGPEDVVKALSTE